MSLFFAFLAHPSANASMLFMVSEPSGLAAEVEFTLVDPTTLKVRVKNTSTDVPDGFDSADQILTSVSWDFDATNPPGEPIIISGSVKIGSVSNSLNFDAGAFGPGAEVSGEWGFGNIGGTGLMPNLFSAMNSHTTPFGGANLDSTSNLNGPQGGLVTDPPLIPVGGLGAICNEVVATLRLSAPIGDLTFLNDIVVEYGSDAAFVHADNPQVGIPEPSSAMLLGVGLIALVAAKRFRSRVK